jgi:surface polysaccharide O-acyltransferase-like enzyme
MICILHILLQGGILNNATIFSTNYEIAWLLELMCISAVNCYALISGYIMYNIKVKYKRIVNLWFQVIFYSVGITFIYAVFNRIGFLSGGVTIIN